MKSSSARLVSRLAALVILIAAIAGLIVGVVLPIFERHRSNEQRLAGEMERAARFRDFIARSAGVEFPKNAVRVVEFPEFIEGQTPALQVAALQDAIVRALLDEGIKPHATRALTAEDRAGMERVGVQVELTAELDRLIRVIGSLSNSKEQLSVERIRMSPQAPRDEQRRDVINARLSVYGFTAPQTGKKGG